MNETPVQAQQNDIGILIRGLRKSLKLTLVEFSRRSGLPVSTLSRLETGKMGVSYEKLLRISAALEVDLISLFGRNTGVVQQSKGDTLKEPSSKQKSMTNQLETRNYVHIYSASSMLTKHFFPVVIEPKSSSLDEFGPLSKHSGEEFIFVLVGQVEVHTENYAPVFLVAGESMYIESQLAHAYLKTDDQPCRMLVVCASGIS